MNYAQLYNKALADYINMQYPILDCINLAHDFAMAELGITENKIWK